MRGRIVVLSSPLALHGTARFGPTPLRATRLPRAPPVVSEERSSIMRRREVDVLRLG